MLWRLAHELLLLHLCIQQHFIQFSNTQWLINTGHSASICSLISRLVCSARAGKHYKHVWIIPASWSSTLVPSHKCYSLACSNTITQRCASILSLCYIKCFCSISSLGQKRGLPRVMMLQQDLINIGIFPPFTVKQTMRESSFAQVQLLASWGNVNCSGAGQGHWEKWGRNTGVHLSMISVVC